IGCVPSCEGKGCGDDGCGGTCGTCSEGEECKEGVCIAPCVPDCTDKQCGDDGCEGSCGSCPDEEECKDGQCEPVCKPFCLNKECGPDGCDGVCGECGDGFACNDFGVCAEIVSADPEQDVESTDAATGQDAQPDFSPAPDGQAEVVNGHPDTAAPLPDTGPDSPSAADASQDVGGDSQTSQGCPPGMVMYYGKCAYPKEAGAPQSDSGKSGCGAAHGPVPATAVVGLLLLAALLFCGRWVRTTHRGIR
ncbi:MAG: hypothetical protein FJ109_13690, partial [Deltaproteobacteria bacterium]|nr:hypothetical protein [Deltaproteobacteria bacterium]